MLVLIADRVKPIWSLNSISKLLVYAKLMEIDDRNIFNITVTNLL